jgi:hypothetical protein
MIDNAQTLNHIIAFLKFHLFSLKTTNEQLKTFHLNSQLMLKVTNLIKHVNYTIPIIWMNKWKMVLSIGTLKPLVINKKIIKTKNIVSMATMIWWELHQKSTTNIDWRPNF